MFGSVPDAVTVWFQRDQCGDFCYNDGDQSRRDGSLINIPAMKASLPLV